MGKKRSLGRRLALGCGGLIVLLVVLAFVGWAILRAMGGRRANSALARLKAAGVPTTWEEVIPPPVPEDQNAAPLYADAFAALVMPSQSNQAILDYLGAPDRAARQALAEDVERIMANDAKALSYLRQAAERPKCRFDRDWSDPLAKSPPEYSQLYQIPSLTCAQAQLRADRGDMKGALEAWSLTLAPAKHLESDPLTGADYVRFSIIDWATSSLPRILQDGRPSPEDCRRAADALARLDFNQPFLRALATSRIRAGLRLQGLHMQQIRHDPMFRPALLEAARLTERVPPNPALRAGSESLLFLGYEALRPLDEAAMLQSFEKQIALARKPYREALNEYDTVERQMPRYAIGTRLCAPLFPRASGVRDTAIAEAAMMRTGLGLAAYRTQFGRYPDSLDQLRAALKWEVPEDPFSGKDLIYRRVGSGYVLYSLGRDLDDDGGRQTNRPAYSSLVHDQDLAFRVER